MSTMRSITVIVLAVLAGCAPSRSTRMTAEDLSDMAHAMAQSLSQSQAVASRHARSPAWIVSIDKVLNLSSDVMTESEQWYVVSELRASLPMQALADRYNVRFVIPAEQTRRMRADDQLDAAGFGADRQATHQMTATFRSVDRGQARDATSSYYCEFELIDLSTGEPVWIDRFEYKRVARGHIWD